MPLLTTSSMRVPRNTTVKYVDARKRSFNAIIRAITGATLTLYIPSLRTTLTTVPKATTPGGPGWHHRL